MKTQIKRITSSGFFKGSVVFTLASLVVNVLNFLFNLIVARFFPLNLYGEYMAALSYLMFLSVPIGAISILLIKRIGATSLKDRGNFVASLEKWIFFNFKKHLGLVFATILMLGVIMFYQSNLEINSILMVLVMLVLSLIATIYPATLQAYKNFFLAGLAPSLTSIIRLGGAVLVVFFIPSLTALYLLMIFVGIASIYIGKKFVDEITVQSKKTEFKITNPLSLTKTRSVLIPLLSTLGMVGIINVDMMIVKKLLSPDQAGLYAGLALLGKIILYASAPLTAVSYAFFTGSETKRNRFKILLITIVLLVLCSVGLLGVYWLFPEFVITLILGPKFLELSQLVWMSAIFGGSYALANLLIQYFISKNHLVGLVSILGLVAQVAGILLFHETFMQVLIVGTATSLFISASCFVFLFTLRKHAS